MPPRRPNPLLRRIGTRLSLGLVRRRTALALATLTGLVVCSAAGASGPDISFTLTGTQGDNGWYRSNVGIAWVVNGGTALSGCVSTTLLSDTPGSVQSCTATDTVVTNSSSVTIKIDKTPPAVTTATAQRPPDANGWYNHPVSFSFAGSDGGSGIAACSQATYSGPDNGSAAVAGTCRDKAGNSGTNAFGFSYDATPPSLARVSVASEAGTDVVRWTSSSASDAVVVRRAARGNKAQPTVFRGSASSFTDTKIQGGLEYIYSVQAYDQAGNASKKVSAVGLPKVLTLRKTPYTPRAASKPILHWDAVRGASYYHVQLFRGQKRILAAWPNGPQLGLPAAWTWAGHRYRLTQGRYRWYVWAGIGRRSFARYRTLGSAAFIVPRR
jgi:hypothetical protein